MEEVTLDKLAKDVGTTVDRLVTQFAEAGMKKSAGDSVTEDEKQALLAHLNKQHGGKGPQEPSKMTLFFFFMFFSFFRISSWKTAVGGLHLGLC